MVHQTALLPDLFYSDRCLSRHHPLRGRTVPNQTRRLGRDLRPCGWGRLFTAGMENGAKLGHSSSAIVGSDDLAGICDGDFLHNRRPNHRNQNAGPKPEINGRLRYTGYCISPFSIFAPFQKFLSCNYSPFLT